MDESRQTDAMTAGGEPEEVKDERPDGLSSYGAYPTPLFLRDVSDGAKGNAQDEKDETTE
jgi:hypothetical protein